jgi:cell wall assembly regulator SMI1
MRHTYRIALRVANVAPTLCTPSAADTCCRATARATRSLPYTVHASPPHANQPKKTNPCSEADTLDAIRHLTKHWRSTASKWRCGFGENICLKYRDEGGKDGKKVLVMELEDARSHDQKTYAAALSNLSMVAHEGAFLGFLQQNVGENVLHQESLPKPDGYVAIVCRASSEQEAAHFAVDLRHLVTEAVVADAAAKQRKHRATFHQVGGVLADAYEDYIYGMEEVSTWLCCTFFFVNVPGGFATYQCMHARIPQRN